MGKNQDKNYVDGQALNFARVMIESGFLSRENRQPFIEECCLPAFRDLDTDVFPTSILSICFGEEGSLWAHVSVEDAIIKITDWIESRTMKAARISLPSMFSRSNRDDYEFFDTGTFAPGEFFVGSLGHNPIATYNSLMHHNWEYGLQGYNLDSLQQGYWVTSFLKLQREMRTSRMGSELYGFKTENVATSMGIVDYVLMQAVLVAGNQTPMDANGTYTAFPFYIRVLNNEHYSQGSMLLAHWNEGNVEMFVARKYSANPDIGIRFSLYEIPLMDD